MVKEKVEKLMNIYQGKVSFDNKEKYKKEINKLKKEIQETTILNDIKKLLYYIKDKNTFNKKLSKRVEKGLLGEIVFEEIDMKELKVLLKKLFIDNEYDFIDLRKEFGNV